MLADPGSLDFTPFHIFGADGQQYTGIRPSVIPKPFKSAVVVLGGKTFGPGLPEGYSRDHVLGYDAAVRIGINMDDTGRQIGDNDKAYRLITLLKDGRRWSKLVFLDSSIKEDWMNR